MDIKTNITWFLKNCQIVEGLVSRLGTNEDSIALRQQLEEIREQTKNLDMYIAKIMQSEDIQDKDVIFGPYLQMKPSWKLLYKESLKKESALPVPKVSENRRQSFDHQQNFPETIQTNESEEPPVEFNLLQTHNYNSKQEVLQEMVQERNQKVSEIKQETENVAQTFALAAQLVKNDTEKLAMIESNVKETEQVSSEGVLKVAQAAKIDANSNVTATSALSGAVIGGVLGGIFGPFGFIVGTGTGAKLGSYVGTTVQQIKSDSVDREMFQYQLAKQNKWQNDDEATNCRICNTQFNSLIRKHHCRKCGQIVCHSCSTRRVPLQIPGMEESKPVRVCDSCYYAHWDS